MTDEKLMQNPRKSYWWNQGNKLKFSAGFQKTCLGAVITFHRPAIIIALIVFEIRLEIGY